MIVFGTRNTRRTLATGEFACPKCGVDRTYRHIRAKRWGHIFFIPLIPLGEGTEMVQCDVCKTNFSPDVLGAPTSSQFADELNQTVQLLVMTAIAGGVADRPVRAESARSFLSSRGWGETEVEATVGWALAADVQQSGELSAQLFRQMAKVAPRLEPQGVEQLVMSFGWIVASDGAFGPEKSALVAELGRSAGLTAAHVQGIVATVEQSVRPAT